MAERKDPLQVKGSGVSATSLSTPLDHKIRLPIDHPDGKAVKAPMTIIDETGTDFHNFQKALDFTTNEPQVLILLYDPYSFSSIISNILPEGSYIQHNSDNSDNNSAAAWVKELQHHQQTEENKAEADLAKPKYLIADWSTAAGFEAPAVILVIGKTHPNRATMCQRAKAKLVIYHTKMQ